MGDDRRHFLGPRAPGASGEARHAPGVAPGLADAHRHVQGHPPTSGEAWPRERASWPPLPAGEFAWGITRPAPLTPYRPGVFETHRDSVPADAPAPPLLIKAEPFRVARRHLEQGLASQPRGYGREQALCAPCHSLP